MRILASDKENQKIIVIAVLIAFSCFLTVYFHLVLGISHVFTHFFYIPVILAAFWWKRKGIVVAVFLTGVLITGHLLEEGVVAVEEYLMAFLLLSVSIVVVLLSERVAREEKKVEDSHAELDQIFQTAADGMRVVDKDFNVLRMNDTFLKLAGIRRNDVTGRKCYEVFSGPRCHTPDCPLTRILGGKDYVEDEVEKERVVDGLKIPCIVTATPVRGSGGDVIGIVEDYKDITERKQAEEQLRQFTEELEQKVADHTAQLNASLKEKEMLLKEIHHRVKNNLQIIISLLNLQIRKLNDPRTIDALKDSQSRMRSMALVHKKLYRSDNFASINFGDYIKTLSMQLINLYSLDPFRIKFIVDMKDVAIDINQAIPVGLLMNELISNALKHAFPDGRKGEIAIRGEMRDSEMVITVMDNGIGIPSDFDWRNAESVGLRLVITLVEQLQGMIELNRTEGTAFTIVVKEKE